MLAARPSRLQLQPDTVYPCLPGHEVVGRVARVGSRVSRHRTGDLVGVGCMMDSCRQCPACESGEENYCEGPNSWLATYNGPMVPRAKAPTHENMYGRDNTDGGYSTSLVVPEDFVLRIPEGLSPQAAAPILCAAVTTYSPMKRWGVKEDHQVGIIGLGGLGHLAVKLARALGAEVTVFTSREDKVAAGRELGASRVVVEGDQKATGPLEASLDFILSTVPKKHDLNRYIPLLKRDRSLVVVGALEPME